jgi:hypothetical protein
LGIGIRGVDQILQGVGIGLGICVYQNNVATGFAGDFQTLVDALDEAEVALVLDNGDIQMAARKRLQHSMHVRFTRRIVDDDQTRAAARNFLDLVSQRIEAASRQVNTFVHRNDDIDGLAIQSANDGTGMFNCGQSFGSQKVLSDSS